MAEYVKMEKDTVFSILDIMVSGDYSFVEDDADIVADRIAAYVAANIDDFMECYDEEA